MNEENQPSHEYSVVPTNEESSSKNQSPSDEKFYLRKRYYVSIFAFLGLVLNFVLRINVSICIVDMTSNKTVIIDNVTYTEPAEYNWTSPEKGLILSSFSWGFLFTPLGYIIVDRLGGATTLGYIILLLGTLTVLSPMLISSGMILFMFARGFEGFAEGMTTSCIFAICATWIPANERSRVVNFITLGVPGGTMISYFLIGIINYYFGWKAVFYITGVMAFIWYLVWSLTTANSPEMDKYITKKEMYYLKEKTKHIVRPARDTVLPWKSILTSKATWAYLNERFVEAWSTSFLTYCIPLYIKDVHSSNVMNIGLFSALPHFFCVVSIIAGSFLQDYIRAKTSISNTKLHKSFVLFGQIVAVLVLVLVGLWINFYWNMIAFCVFKIGFSIAEVSYVVIPIDLSPQYSHFLGGLAMCAIAMGYLLNPLTMGFMVQNHEFTEWSRYFFLLACFNAWGAIIFTKYGSGEPQTWGQRNENEN